MVCLVVYLRPLPDAEPVLLVAEPVLLEAEPVEAPLLRVLELPELLVELLLLLTDELVEVPLLRRLLEPLPTRLPLLPVAEPVATLLGRELLFELFTRLLLPLAEPVEVPLGRLVEPELLPMRLLLDPLPLTEPVEAPLWLLPELMLPPLALGRTVALGAFSLLLGAAGGLLFTLGWVAG